MIVTSLGSPELALYAKLNKYFEKIFEIAKAADPETIEAGRYELDGDDCFYTVHKYETNDTLDAKFETHEKYIDVQIILSGEEEIRFQTLDKLTALTEYDTQKDIAFWKMTDEYDSVRFETGELTVIFPQEPHAPSLDTENGKSSVVKLVAKVRA